MFGRATIRLGIGPHSSYYCRPMVCGDLSFTVFAPPYSSMGGYLVYCLFVFCLFFCTVTDFSAAKKIDAGNFAYVFDCYPYKSSLSVCLFGVTATALLPG